MNKRGKFLTWLTSLFRGTEKPDENLEQILTQGGTFVTRPVDSSTDAQGSGDGLEIIDEDIRIDVESSSQGGLIIGGNVSGSTVITGNGNIIRDYDIYITRESILDAADHFYKTYMLKDSPWNLQSAIRKYFEFIVVRYRYLETRGFAVHDRLAMKFPLLSLYVPQMARQTSYSHSASGVRMELAGREITDEHEHFRFGQSQPLIDILRRHSGMILLGDPGSGKTTFLKFLALRLAVGEGEALGIGGRLPILLPISAYANELSDKAGNLALEDFIRNYFRAIGVDLPIDSMLKQALNEGRALILLDGLDEISDLTLRGRVMERVKNFYAFHMRRGNKFVLTSRIVGYSEVRPSIEGLVECTLLDFNNDQIQTFIEHWTLTIEKQVVGDNQQARQNAIREQQTLWAAIQRNESVRALASNPLLLTILALIKRQGVSLPERRVELYDISLNTLLTTWNRARSLTGEQIPGRDVNTLDTLKLLAPLAYWMHTESPGVGLVHQRDLEEKLIALFNERGEPGIKAASQFMKDVRDYTGILLERGFGQYGFIHLTFEEYLAAIAIAQRGQLDWHIVADELIGRVGQSAWREIILLCVGYIGLIEGRDKVAGNIIQSLLERRPGVPGEAVLLAGEAVLDFQPGGVPNHIREIVVNGLISVMQDEKVVSKYRRRAGLVLGWLDWKLDDLEAFIDIPAGDFIYGDPDRLEPLPYSYSIMKYPVTNRLFAEFVQAGGYSTQRFWSKNGWEWKRTHSRSHPIHWDDMKWNNPIFPVVGVSWYEAEAFAKWYTAHLREKGELPQDHVVRLPKEEEWEKASRWTDGREFPWGGDFDPKFANTKRSNLEGTTAVCTYLLGVSKYGIWDMSGNSLEWTWSTVVRKYVLRGGSWEQNELAARCVSRGESSFDTQGLYVGIRLVRSSVEHTYIVQERI